MARRHLLPFFRARSEPGDGARTLRILNGGDLIIDQLEGDRFDSRLQVRELRRTDDRRGDAILLQDLSHRDFRHRTFRTLDKHPPLSFSQRKSKSSSAGRARVGGSGTDGRLDLI
ncbi:hypothetical protein NKH83_31145 [Mesorhizobium sp. M0909]